MRRLVLILPQWLSVPESQGVLRSSLPGLAWFAERGTIRKCLGSEADPAPNTERGQCTNTPEAAWLGLDPATLALQDGPLTVSAFGADPPADSVHFHASLMSLSDGVAVKVDSRIQKSDLAVILEASKKLNTKALTLVAGEQADHGLVWEEGSIELGTYTADYAAGKAIRPHLPEGDGEALLRRFIDDSVNMLSVLEFNKRREEEGSQPLNLWWPWGQGFRVAVPNLAVRRGEMAWVESNSMRLQGLTRLSGYRHGNRAGFGWGVRTNLEQVLSTASRQSSTVALIDAFSVFRPHERWEEMVWLTRELDERLFKPLVELAKEDRLSLTMIAAPSVAAASSASLQGLVLSYEGGGYAHNTTPFDERALEEKKIESIPVWRAVAEGLG